MNAITKTTFRQFIADKKVLTNKKKMVSFFNEQYGHHWQESSVVDIKALRVYGGDYWIEEFRSGLFYYDGAMGTGGTFRTLEEAEKDLYKSYF
jgi:hypothetical protein